MQNKSEKESNIIKYPGKVEVFKNNKIVEMLPNYEKIVDKKSNKAAMKNKPNQSSKINYGDLREGNDQKSPEQNLETYSKICVIKS